MGHSTGHGLKRTCTAAALLGTLVLLFAASAQAAPPVTIAGYGEGAGQVDWPLSVAVEQSSGDLYVSDRNNFRVLKFDSAGEFLLGWGWGVADGVGQELQNCGPVATPPTARCFKGAGANVATGPGAVAPRALGVEQSSGDVYVADANNRRVSKFTPSGQFLFMAGKGVNQTEATNVCTAADVEVDHDTCGAGATGSGPNEFTSPVSLAVGASGQVWIGDAGRLQEMGPDGTPGAEIALAGCGSTQALAVNSAGDFYVKCQSLPGIRKLEAGTGALLGTLDAAGSPQALAVDGEDNVFVADSTAPYRLIKLNAAGEKVSQFGAGQVIFDPGTGQGPQGNALAIDDSSGTLYVASSLPNEAFSAVQAFAIPEPGPLIEGQHVEDLLPTTVTLAAELNPEGHETTYRFEYGTSESYGSETPEATLPGTGFDEETVKAALTGLIPATTYHFRLVATNHCKPAEPLVQCTVEGPDATFATLPAIGIEAQWASEVAAHSATLRAELDPLGVAGKWWIEYGTSEALGSQTAKAALPASFGPLSLATAFNGLAPATTYFYRFAAGDERDGLPYLVQGQTRSFTTQLGGLGFGLPDSRAWEMVSPAKKWGGEIGARPGGEGQLQASVDGDALAYLSRGSIEAAPEGNRGVDESSVLARRGPGGKWSSKDITAPHTLVSKYSDGVGLEYRLFSPGLEKALMELRDASPLSPAASERTPYLRTNTEPPDYLPLVSPANAPPGFGNPGEVNVRSASADLSHVVLKSGVPLIAGAANGGLYEWSEGRLEAASELPDGKVVSAEAGTGTGGGSNSVRHAISEDGARVFWTPSTFAGVAGLYVRDFEREETARLDIVQEGAFGTGAANPIFQGADADGTVAFFTDSRQLTADASENGRDLYRCELRVVGEELGCELTDLSAAPGEDARVQGLAAGMSEDGTRVFFTARGVLDDTPNGEGESAAAGAPNLYAWQEGAGVRFVARLSEADARDWGEPGALAFQLSAAASPSGRYLAFMSERPLSGYDNRDVASGSPAEEVFRYDAQAEELTCVSCNPSGARPRALVPGQAPLSREFDPQKLWSGRRVAALLPEASKITLVGASLYRPRAVQDSGRVFFNAADSLVPADSNGDGDVYQYEPTGVGSCAASSGGAGVTRIEGGCVALISSGGAGGTAAFLDASQSGDDVFFYTPAQLAVTDVDHVTDIYDARVGGVEAKLSLSAECQGEACQPPSAAPEDPSPASAAFRGPENLRPRPAARRCPKDRRRVTRKGKARCVARPKSRQRNRERRHRDHHRNRGPKR